MYKIGDKIKIKSRPPATTLLIGDVVEVRDIFGDGNILGVFHVKNGHWIIDKRCTIPLEKKVFKSHMPGWF